MIRFRYLVLIYLAIAIISGYLLDLALGLRVSEIERKSQPFTTHSTMLAITVLIHKDTTPEILDVAPLDEGRVSVVQPGEYVLELQDKNHKTVYSLPFRVVMVKPGDPPKPADEVRRIFVVPTSDKVAMVILSGPAGEAEYELP